MSLSDFRVLIYSDNSFKKNIEYDASNNPVYLGLASPGTLDSVGGWQIRKIVYDVDNNPTDVDFASGSNKFDKVWDDRASYVYS
jgi:hypothetical protein